MEGLSKADDNTETQPLLRTSKTSTKGGNVVKNYDEILAHIGDMGVWQFYAIAILWLPSMAGGIIVLLSSFTALEPSAFRCAIQECDGPFAKYDDILSKSVLYGNNQTTDSCTKPTFMTNGTDAKNCSADRLIQTGFDKCHSATDRFLYDDFEFESTIVTDFSLVCDDRYKVALSGTLYFIGLITGAMTAGFPADYFGRKPVLIFFIIIGGVSNLIGGLVSTFPLYVFFRILAGIGEEGLTILTCTMSVEMVGAKYQSVVGNVNQIFFALGTGITGLCAFFIRDWRSLHLATSCLILPQVLLWWAIPESPRWLITKKKWQPLSKIMATCFKWNKAEMPSDLIIPLANEPQIRVHKIERKTDKSILQWYSIFTRPILLKRTCILILDWGLVALVYYGIGMSMTQLGGNIFINFIMSAVGEVLGCIFNIIVSNCWGRKPTVVVGFLVSGLCCMTAGVLPTSGNDLHQLRLFLLIFGKIGCSAALNTCYVYTSELFPTPIRNTAVGFCSMSSRLVAMSAPFLTLYLPDVTFTQLPFIIFGFGTLLGAGLSVFLPESLGHPLPDTYEDAAQMGTKPFWSCWSMSKLQEEIDKQRTSMLNKQQN